MKNFNHIFPIFCSLQINTNVNELLNGNESLVHPET